MGIFPWKKKNSIEGQPVDGIVQGGEKTVLSLREKVWKFEIHPKEILTYIRNRPRKVFSITIAIVFVIGSFIYLRTSASESYFYATSCLGGWEHPEHATGAPEVGNDPSDSDFTTGNSALLNKSVSDIYCGGFSGDTPEDIEAGAFTVHFSWLVADQLHQEQAPLDTIINGSEPVTSDDTSSVSSEATSSDTTSGDTSTDSTPALDTPSDTPVQQESPAPENTPAPVEQAPPVVESTPTTFRFIPIVRAQETPLTVEGGDATTVIDAIPETNGATDTSEVEITSGTTTVVSDTSSGDFLEALYSLDGIEWKHLGYVGKQNWRNASFVINEPLMTWGTASKIQIELKSLPTFDEPSVIYLDSVYLTIAHKKEEVLLNPPKVHITDSSVEIISGKQNFQSGEIPTFTITDPGLSADDIATLVEEEKANIVEDTAGVLGEPVKAPAPPLPTTDTVFDPLKEIINPVIEDTPTLNTETPPDVSFQPTSFLLRSHVNDFFSFSQGFLKKSGRQLSSIVKKTKRKISSLISPQIAEAYTGQIDTLVLDANGNATDITADVVTVSENGTSHREVRVPQSREFRPGRYTLRVSLHTPQAIIVSEQNFTWGVLALNFDKTIYQAGDTAYVQMGVLNDVGHTICNADVELSIKTPSLIETHFSTADSSVVREPLCGPDNVISVPDYFAHYTVPAETGVYTVSLTATTSNGTKTVSDSFQVVTTLPMTVVRSAPTRIYPWATYPVTLRVTSATAWSGTVTEIVPASFEISQPLNSTDYDAVVTHGDEKVISWNVSLVPGEEKLLGYYFDAPNISPEFYLIGPATFTTSGVQTFQEYRHWQIASDAACNATGSGTWSATANFTSCTGAASGGAGTGNRPGTGDSLTINSGVALTADTTASITALTFAASTAATSVTVSNAITLTVTGATSIPAPGAGGTNTLTTGSGTSGAFSTAGITLTGSATAGRNSVLAIATGSTLTTTSGITFAGTAAQAQLTNAGASTINLTGTMSTGGTVTINAGTTLNTSGTVTLSRATTFGILSVNSGTTTMGAVAVTVAGTTTVTSGATLTASSATGRKTFTGNITVDSTGVFDLKTASNFATVTTFGGNITANGTTFNSGTGAVTLSGTGAKSFNGSSAISLGGTLTVPTNVALTNNNMSTVTLGALTIASPTASNSVTFATGTTTSITGALTFTANAAAGQSQTVTLQGTAAVSAASITMPATTSTGTATITATGSGGSLTVSGTTAITGSATASGGLSKIDFTGVNTNFTTNALTVVAGTTGAASMIIGSGTFTSNGLVTLTGAASGSQLATLTTATGTLLIKAGLTQSGTVIANATFTTTGAATVTFTGTMTGAGTKTINSATTFNTTGTVALNAAVTLPTLNVLAGTTTLGAVAITVSGATNITGALANASSATAKTFTGLVTVNSGGSVALTTTTVPAVNFAGGITVNSGAGSVNFGTGTTTFTANQSLGGPGNFTLGAVVINSGVTLTNGNTGTVTMASLVMPVATAANNFSLSTGSTTTVTGQITFSANTQANPQTITMNGTANLNAGTFQINAPTGAGGSFVTCASGATGTLTVTGAFSMVGNSTSTGPVTVAMLTCTLVANGLVTINGGTNATGALTVSASTGNLDFNAGITFTGTLAQARITTTGAANVYMTGTISGLGTLSLNASTLVTTQSTTALNAAYTFPNMTVATGTTTLGAAITVSSAFAVSSGAVTKFGGSGAFTVSGTTTLDGELSCTSAVTCAGAKTFTGAVTVNSGATFDLSLGSIAGNNVFSGGITTNTGAVTFNAGTGLTSFSTNSQNLAGTVNMNFGGTVTIQSGVVITNNNTGTVTFAALTLAVPTVANGLSLSTGSTTNVTGLLAFSINNTANNETITMNGTANISAGSVTVSAPTSTGSELFTCAGGSGTFTVSGAMTINGNNTSSGLPTVAMDTCTLSIGGLLTISGGSVAPATLSSSTGTVTIGAGLTFSGTAANARLTTTGAATVNFTGTLSTGGTPSINAATTIHTTGTTLINGTYTIGGNLAVDSGTTTVAGVSLVVTGTTTINGGTLTVNSATGTKTFTGAVTVNSGSFDFSGFAAVTVFAGGITMDGTTFNTGTGTTTFSASQDLTGSAPIVFGGAVTINNTFTLTNNNTSTVDFNSTIAGGGVSANFATGLNSTTRFANTVMATGILTPSTSVNTIEYDGGTQTIKIPTTNPYYNLSITAAGTKSLAGTTTVTGTTTISNGTLDTVSGQNYALNTDSISIGASGVVLAQNSTITVTGNWTNAGTFTAGGSTVLFNGGATAIIDGTTTFNNLTITHSSAKEVNFTTTGTPIFHVTGLFSVTGHIGGLIKLYSDLNGTKWQFHPTGTAVVDYADIKDGGCQAGYITISPTNSNNSNNNESCWSFGVTISFSLSSNLIDFGTLSSLAAQYATDGASSGGSASEVAAHTIDASTTAPSGYIITVFGESLHTLAHTIGAIGGVNSASSVGTEQFGIRATATGGTGAVSSPYDGGGFAYDGEASPSQIASVGSGDGVTTTYSVRYLSNIASDTAAGAYSTQLTYVITSQF